MPGQIANPPFVIFHTRKGDEVTVNGMLVTSINEGAHQVAEGQLSSVTVARQDGEADFSIQWIANIPERPLGGWWPDSTKTEWITTLRRTHSFRDAIVEVNRRRNANDHVVLEHSIDGKAFKVRVGKTTDKPHGFVEFDSVGASLDDDAKRRFLDSLAFILVPAA